MDLNVDIDKVPVWDQFPGLALKFWGHGCLKKIVGLLGEAIKPDTATRTRDRVAYARYLVEMKVDGKIPEMISFKDEKGKVIEQKVKYECKPKWCSMCKEIRHEDCECGQKLIRKKWVPKQIAQNAKESEEDHVNEEEGMETTNEAELTPKDPVFKGNPKKCGYVGRKSPTREMGGNAVPISNSAVKEEQERLEEFEKVSRDYFSFLNQKSKINWLKAGDENTRFFHRIHKILQYQKRVVGVKDINGNWCEGRPAAAEAFVQYYKMLLGSEVQATGVV
ncbi:Chromatin-remodeling ATPase INO80 [Bienertia sinuspersici]